MARKRQDGARRPIESYEHKDKQRVNNPPVGLVTPDTDPDAGAKKTYAYDPHLDPQLQWAGKAEHTSFEVPTVSLHVHERIDPRTIIEAVRSPPPRPSPGGRGWRGAPGEGAQLPLFATPQENPPLRDAIEFYKHAHGWSNRLVAGDSLLVMNSLLEKEGMAGKVQMIYIDPPYGIRYGSNFQPFVNKRDVKDGKDEDLTAEPEQIRAFRDTWELGIHSYLTYLRDRLLLARELLTESGSIFVQISDENLHRVRCLMDEVFGSDNFCAVIAFRKTSARSSELTAGVCDYLVWYAKEKASVRFRPLHVRRDLTPQVLNQYSWLELHDGTRRRLNDDELQNPKLIPEGGRLFRPVLLTSSHEYSLGKDPFVFEGKTFLPGSRYWSTSPAGLKRLAEVGRIMATGNTLNFIRYLDDFQFIPLSDLWSDTATGGGSDRYYVVQTTTKVIERCLLMTTDPGDLVFDPTCGSGTTAYVAEQWGRRWITCDTSRVALTLAKQRLMTAVFDYYELAYPSPQPSPSGRGSEEKENPLPKGEGGRRPGEGELGVWNGFKYKTVPHVTLKSIANNPDIREGMTREQIDAAIARHAPQETLYDQPFVDKKKTRVSGPFTVEAVPAPAVKSVEELLPPSPSGRGAGGEGKKRLDPEILDLARKLRREQTHAECLLWGLLRDRRLAGLKFRRQHPVEPYVLDFYCHEGRLAVELDGGQHNEPDARTRDEQRTAFLNERGIRVLRFWNSDVLTNIEGVLQTIYDALIPALSQGEREFEADASIARSGETLRQGEWRDELLRAGIRGKAGQHIRFARLEPLPGCRWLHADGETRPSDEGADRVREAATAYNPQRIVVSFGPEYAPLEQRQVEHAWEEARTLVPRPKLLVFAAFQFDPEAAKDIDELKPETIGMQLLKVQMNADLLTDDLKKKRASNESFWLIGQPDVQVERILPSRQPSPTGRGWRGAPGEGVKYRVSVHGFDYYNTKTGGVESGGEDRIAVWLLDTDYDGRSLYPRQVFFPMAGENEGWARLAKNLKAEIDEERIEAYRGTVSLPFEPGEHRRIAVKIVDDRGIESLKVMGVE